jgi:hypothetical protein
MLNPPWTRLGADTSRAKSGTATAVSKKFMKSLDHTTDSGSLAGSESITGKSSGGTRRATSTAVTARTTASHNIATKAGNLISKKKNKGKGPNGKDKETAPTLSDEDDSREREAALSSPIKGKISRELNKVSQLILLWLVIVLIVIND